jgi:hypothetical protein
MKASAGTAGMTLTLTGEEREQLLAFLEQALQAKEIEEHRTDSISFRAFVQREAALLQGLVDRLRRG